MSLHISAWTTWWRKSSSNINAVSDMKANQEYKNQALAALKGNWAPSIVATIILILLCVIYMGPYEWMYMQTLNGHVFSSPVLPAVSYFLFIFGTLLVFSPMNLGYEYAFKLLSSDSDAQVTGNMFRKGFKPYFRNVWGMFLMGLFVNLWALLLIIPGIVKAYAYSMTPYILVDYPELSANQAINLSKKMMRGHKFDLFYLHLSFLGWGVLSVFTLGIGLIWLMPYMMTAQAAFYQDVKNDYINKNIN